VGVALKTLNIPGVEKTIMEFVLKFDKLFDCLNVSSLSAGKHSRNAPYHSASDFRIKVCNCKCNTENAVIKVSFVSG
jgi:hypothetical protein